MNKRKLSVFLVLSLVAIGFATSLFHLPRIASAETIAQWNVFCGIDHFGADDPIVYPGKPGYSHMHSFFGNTTTNAYTTGATLQAGASSCSNGLEAVDHSAYWVPSLYKKNADGSISRYDDDRQNVVAYYRRAGGSTGPQVKPFPVGFRMIAGNPHATSPQSVNIVQWDCGEGGPEYPSPPQCEGGASQQLHASLIFPNCWDGVHLDVADHKSHMAYAASSGACPATHPISLPELTFEVDFPYLAGGPDYFVSSEGIYSWHGDFFAAWNNQAQNGLVSNCLNTPQNCAGVYLFGDTFEKPEGDPNQIPPFSINGYSTSSPYSGLIDYTPPPAAPEPPVVAPTTTTPAANKPAAQTPAATKTPAQNAQTSSTPSPATAAAATAAAATKAKADQKRNTATLALGIALGLGVTGFIGYRFYLHRHI